MVLNFVEHFSVSVEVIIWYLFFHLLMWCITLIDFHILKNLRIPGIKPDFFFFFNLIFPVMNPWAGEPDGGAQNSLSCGENSAIYCCYCPVWGLPTWDIWDLIILPVHPSYAYPCGYFFVSVVEDIFWKVPVHFINCCSADSCDFGVLIRDSELRDFLHWQYGYPLQSSVNGPLDCIDSLAIVNSAAMNIWVHEPFQNSISLFFFHIYTQVDLLDHTVVQFSVFRGIATLCSNSDCTSLHSHQLCWRIPFPPHPL